MTQITRMPQSVSTLQDGKTYGVGQDGAITQGKVSGKKETVAASNQKVLDALVMQLKTEYGYDKIIGKELQLPEKLASGKKAITGRDIKLLAQQAIGKAELRTNVGPMCTAVRRMLDSPQPNPAALLKALQDNIPQGVTPQYARLLVGQAMNALSTNQCRQLGELLTGQGMADTVKLLAEAETLLERGFNARAASGEERALIKPKLDQVKALRSMLELCTDGLRLANASRNATTLQGPNIPQLPQQITVGQGQYSWRNAPTNLKTSLTGVNVSDPVAFAKEQLALTIDRQSSQSVLRENSPGEVMLKQMLDSFVTPHAMALLEEMIIPLGGLTPAELTRLGGKPDRTEFLNSPRGQEFIHLLGVKLTSDPLRTALAQSMSLLGSMVKVPLSDKFPGDQFGAQMSKAFNGGSVLPMTFYMDAMIAQMPEGQNKERCKVTARLIMQAFAETTPGNTVLTPALSQLPGWDEMMTPPPGEGDIV